MRTRKTGSIRKRKDGRYEGRIFLGRHPNGTPKTFSVFAATQTECESALKAAIDQVAITGKPPDAKLTLRKYLASWMVDHVKRRLAPNTHLDYQNVVDHYIAPNIGTIKLVDLTVPAVQAWVDRLEDSGVSAHMVGHARRILRSALSEAMRIGKVTHNAAKTVRVPSYKRPKVEPLTPAHAKGLLKAASADEHTEALIWVALALGLRKSEALGLWWSDVDLDEKHVHVHQQLAWNRKHRRWERAALKTDQSERVLTLAEPIVFILRQQQARIAVWRKEAGKDWHVAPWVFPSRVGTPINPANLHRVWHRIRLAAGVPTLRFHGLRHGSATLDLLMKTPIEVLSKRLGHSGIRITADTYGHILPALETEAADRLGGLLDPTSDPTSQPSPATPTGD